MNVLVIEDDSDLRNYLERALREAGHIVDVASDGRDALYLAAEQRHDVMVLDRMLPNVDGLTLLQTVRACGNSVPVLMISALGEVDHRVEGLRKGSDDYLAKPFSISELLARVEALGRRLSSKIEPPQLTAGELSMDLLNREVRIGGTRVDLTAREFRIVEVLLRSAGRVVTRTMLLEQVWGYRFDPQTNIVDQHVSRVRQKIDRGGAQSLIETVRGSGYRIAETN